MGLSFEDPLTYLPRKPVQEFGKGWEIYGPQQAADALYLVIQGRVKVTSAAEDGCQTTSRIVPAEGLFGESALIGVRARAETAVALDAVSLMAWTRNEIEQQIGLEPRLGMALSQHLVRQCLELQDRIESMAVYKTPERVMLALIQLAATQGVPQGGDSATRLQSLTHQTIAEYVGTSREIVTFQMNRLRRLGLLRYSRRHIDVHVPAMREALRQRGVMVLRSSGTLAKRAGS